MPKIKNSKRDWVAVLPFASWATSKGWEPDWDNVNQAKYSITTNEKGLYFIATEHRFFWMTNVAFKSFKVADEALRLIKDCNALEDV